MARLTVGQLRAATEGLGDDAEIHVGIGVDFDDADNLDVSAKWIVTEVGVRSFYGSEGEARDWVANGLHGPGAMLSRGLVIDEADYDDKLG